MKNGKIGICVIGAGRAGMIHARNFRNNVPGAELIAVADPVEEVAKAGAAELGLEKYYLSHTDALNNPEIDAYVVVSPTKYHLEIVQAIAAEKKHILCEKPMAMTIAECDAMIAAAKENQVKLQIGFMRRFDSSFRQAKEAVDAGEIGDVVMVRSNTRGPSIPKPWMYDISKSNGPLAEVNSHDIDSMRWFANGEFQSLYAIGGNYRCPDAKAEFPDFYDNVVLTAQFDNGVQGMLDGAQGVGYAYDAKMEILGTKGCIYLGNLRGSNMTICYSDSGTATYPLIDSWRGLFKDAYLNEDIAFINAIEKDTEPEVTGHDGKMAVAVVNAGNTSITEKRIVTLDVK